MKNNWFDKYDNMCIDDFKQEFICEFTPAVCQVADLNGNHCNNEPKYRKYKGNEFFLCDECYKNFLKEKQK